MKQRDALSFSEFATAQADPRTPTPDAEAEFWQLLEIAARDPVLALPGLDDIAFTESPHADDARQIAQAIRVAELEGNKAYTLTALGQTLGGLGNWALSAEALENALAEDASYAEAWAYLGEAQQHLGQDGSEALLKARQLNPLSLAANLLQALELQRQGEHKEAKRFLLVAAQIDPQNPSVYVQLGHNLVLSGEIPAARTYYEQALTLAPQDVELWKILATYSLDNDIYVEEVGLPAARRALLLKPRDPDALVLMGRAIFLTSGQGAQAKSLFEQALEIEGEHLDAHLQLGLYLLGVSDLADAHYHLQEVLRHGLGSPEADLAVQILKDYFPR